jgi:hypothetical protein
MAIEHVPGPASATPRDRDPGGSIHPCFTCGAPAACIGLYEEMTEDDTPQASCNGCCGHGNEDGHCEPIDSEAGRTMLAILLGEST